MNGKLIELTERLSRNISENLQLNEYYLLAFVVFGLCSGAILVSIGIKFSERDESNVRKEKWCPVATLTMALVFFLCVPFIQFNIGTVKMSAVGNLLFFLLGALLMVSTTILNIYGRYYIDRFWSDSIVIRNDHEVVMDGPFCLVRHPMYSSLIFFGIGISFVFLNLFVFLVIACIFIPMMIYRARSEEKELQSLNNADYKNYRKEVHILIPKFKLIVQIIMQGVGLILAGVILLVYEITDDLYMFLGFYFLLLTLVLDNRILKMLYALLAVGTFLFVIVF